MFHTCEINDHANEKRSDGAAICGRMLYLKDEIEKAATYLKTRTKYRPKIAMMCDSEFVFLGDYLEENEEFLFSTIPNFPKYTDENRTGKLIFGKLSQIPVLYMQGSLYLYEGNPLWKCTLPIRIIKELGIEVIITITKARGINKSYQIGDIMFVEDHIDLVRLFGHFSLRGTKEELCHFEYSPVNRIYDKNFLEKSVEIGVNMGLEDHIHKGIYTYTMGPNLESNADDRLLKVMGSDAVGNTIVHEAIVAKHCGIDVIGLCVITSSCIIEYEDEEGIDQNKEFTVGNELEEILKKLVGKIVEYVNETKFKNFQFGS
ncbi:hypothetical protein HHI36_012416 [Cryptolaemus montrouzieri]|uniref:purine-nucleoside phosphorylase n=1 Tax=Cryptolaemus montrouzieri TaxID=559131 RepID=A0ABD2NEZ2_9CUCU